ncbi:SMI1/KNR4 family protein [Sphingomonas jaspsi]|uniref:SMI1/KNR4 family protein n=1 Tax=Sphingomonas jaspsi TaxID=392409 RepID=UPI0004AF76CF|nr:SMI1/KNR4 family protein [Sphingomonas jaspsi]
MAGWLSRADHAASAEQIETLKAICPIELPASYLALLAESDGAEAGLSVDPLWLVIYDAAEVIEIATSGAFAAHFPGHFLFGDSGGADAFAFVTLGNEAGQIVTIEVGATDEAAKIRPVADSFDALLALIDT